jgi:hypothetical protein
MFAHKVKVEGELLDKAKKCAQLAGYASVDEFILHLVEKEIARIMPPGAGDSDSEELVKKRLQGLGYIE